jgi:hypothetical protein
MKTQYVNSISDKQQREFDERSRAKEEARITGQRLTEI